MLRLSDSTGAPLVGLTVSGCGVEDEYVAVGALWIQTPEVCNIVVADESSHPVAEGRLLPGAELSLYIEGLSSKERVQSELFLLESMVDGMNFSSDAEAEAYARMLNPYLDVLEGIEAGDTGLWEKTIPPKPIAPQPEL